MSKFLSHDAKSPATLGAVLEAVTHLSTFSEAQIAEFVSNGKLKDLFPFSPSGCEPIEDFEAENALRVAGAQPLSPEQRAVLINTSMPSGDVTPIGTARSKRRPSKK